MTVGDQDKLSWKSYHKKPLNTEITWDSNSLSQAETVFILIIADVGPTVLNTCFCNLSSIFK